MFWLIGTKPAVMNAEIETQNDCRNARAGSMPMVMLMQPTDIVEIAMNVIQMRPMNCVVCTTLGTTCSLRPSDVNSDAPPPLPNKPKDKPTTTKPKPPIRCIMKRHMLSEYERWSRSWTTDAPVVVRPETASNNESR